MKPRVVSPPLEEMDRLRQPLTDGERMVLNYFLANLPVRWEIYVQPHLNGLRPDFVLLHPKNGIAVYEVKDWDFGAMEYFVETKAKSGPKLMARKGDKTFLIERQNPVSKIQLYKEEIYALYCPRLPSREGFGSIVAGIIFPYVSDESVQRLLEPLRRHYKHIEHSNLYPIVGADTLRDGFGPTFKKNVLPIVNRVDVRMSGEIASDLRHWLVEPEFAAEQRRLLMADLTPIQRRLVTSRTATGYRRIRGAAGSGKTFVLAGRAAELARVGKRVLVITFNITLINYILDMAVRFSQSGKVRSQIVALNFHAWCKRVAYASGRHDEYRALWSGEDDENVLRRRLGNAAKDWTRGLSEDEKWDAILVDEAQDFELSWWIALRQALRPAGEALLCADNAQNIYGVQQWTEDQMKGAGFRGEWNTLERSHRISPALCELAGEFISRFLPDVDAERPEPTGEFEFKTILKWWTVPHGSAAQYCVRALLEIVGESEPAIAYADLTCIVESEAIGREVVRLLNDSGLGAIHTFGNGETPVMKYYDGQRKKQAFFKGDARVKVTTLHSFKGWEAKALVIHIARAHSNADLALAYAGITRLKRDDLGCYMTVVCEATELAEYGKKWPVYREKTEVIAAP